VPPGHSAHPLRPAPPELWLRLEARQRLLLHLGPCAIARQSRCTRKLFREGPARNEFLWRAAYPRSTA
jgi:hypothetical protein